MAMYLVPALITLAIFAALIGVRTMFPGRQRVAERLQDIRGDLDHAITETGPGLTETPLPPFLRGVAAIGWVFPSMVLSEDLQWDLAHAGYRRQGTAGLFVGVKVTLGALLAGIMFMVAAQMRFPQDRLIVCTLGAAALGFFLPSLWLNHMASKRREDIRLSLPDALDLMVVCVEAGQGLNSALLTVGREMKLHAQNLSTELKLINQEIRAGLTRSQALRNFAGRTGVEEARTWVAVMVQSDKLGTSIAKALRVHADSMRTRRRQRAEEAARKTAIKLLFPLILCIFPSLLVVILAPAMIQIYRVLVESAV